MVQYQNFGNLLSMFTGSKLVQPFFMKHYQLSMKFSSGLLNALFNYNKSKLISSKYIKGRILYERLMHCEILPAILMILVLCWVRLVSEMSHVI